MAADGDLIFPLGQFVGAQHDAEGTQPTAQLLRIGWDVHRLTGDQLGVWAIAHGLPEGHEMAPWTRSAVEGAARAAGVADAPNILAGLLAAEYALQVRPDGADAVDFARVCRTRSLTTGLGNTRDEPGLYGIGLAGAAPILRVPSFTYELWKWGHACDNLWDACRILARAVRAGSAEQVLPRCLAAVQVLIAHGVGYLDVAREP